MNSLVHPKGAILQVIVPEEDVKAVVRLNVKVVAEGADAIVNESLKIDSLAPAIFTISY